MNLTEQKRFCSFERYVLEILIKGTYRKFNVTLFFPKDGNEREYLKIKVNFFIISAILNNHFTQGFDFLLQTKTLEQYLDEYATPLWYKSTNNLVILSPVLGETHDLTTMMNIYPNMVWYLILTFMFMVVFMVYILNYLEGFQIKIYNNRHLIVHFKVLLIVRLKREVSWIF